MRLAIAANCYMVFDQSAAPCEVLENPFKDYDRAGGVRVAAYLSEKAVDILAAANLGTGFKKVLESKGICHVKRDEQIDWPAFLIHFAVDRTF